LFIAQLRAYRANTFSVDACFSVNATAAGNHRYALTTAVSGAAGALTPTIAAHFAARTIHAGDGLIGAVSGAFRFSHRMTGFILASEVVGVSRAGLYPSCEDPSARGTVWPIIGAIVSVVKPNLTTSHCRIPGPGDTGVVEESGRT